MDEQWTPLVGIPEIEGQFLISNKGRVKRIAFNNYTKTEFKKMHTIKTGYVYVQFYYNGSLILSACIAWWLNTLSLTLTATKK